MILKKTLPPHPATVISPKRPLAAPASRPPHPAVALPRALSGSFFQRPPHAATLAPLGRALVLQRSFDPIGAVRGALERDLTPEERELALTMNSWSDLGAVLSQIAILESQAVKSKSSIPKSSIVESSDASEITSLDNDTLFALAYKSSNAQDVSCFVNSQKVVAAKSDPNDFALLGQGKNQKDAEIITSSKDGEVAILSAAFAAAAGQGGVVELCGPYGPCDGCKQRIRYFAELWMKTVKSGTKLVVHYIYANVQLKARNNTTTYGDPSDNYQLYGKQNSKKKDTLYIHTWTATA